MPGFSIQPLPGAVIGLFTEKVHILPTYGEIKNCLAICSDHTEKCDLNILRLNICQLIYLEHSQNFIADTNIKIFIKTTLMGFH